MKTYTEIYSTTWRNITIYPFVPEGTLLKGFEGSLVIPLLDLQIKWNLTIRNSINFQEWQQLDTAMRRAFEITNWNKGQIEEYVRQQNEGTN